MLNIARQIQKTLNDQYIGHRVVMTRNSDVFVFLQKRCDIANQEKAVCFVSIHVNAGGGTGFESFVVPNAHPQSAGLLHRNIHQAMSPVLKKYGLRDRGRKVDTQAARGRIHVVRATKMKACLTENLFIDTKKDADLLKKSSFLQEVAVAHADAIARTEGLKRKATPTPAPSPSPSTGKAKYRVVAGSYEHRGNAEEQIKKLEKAGFKAFLLPIE